MRTEGAKDKNPRRHKSGPFGGSGVRKDNDMIEKRMRKDNICPECGKRVYSLSKEAKKEFFKEHDSGSHDFQI